MTPAKGSMNAISISYRWVPKAAVLLDEALAKSYLDGSLEERCVVAAEAGFPPFVAAAGLPLEQRKELLRSWRKQELGRHVISKVGGDYGEWLAGLPARERKQIEAGDFEWARLEEGLCRYIDQRKLAELEAARGRREFLFGAVRSLFQVELEEPGRPLSPSIPQALVVLEDGSVTFFTRRNKAKLWAQQRGGDFLLMDLVAQSARIYEGQRPFTPVAAVDQEVPSNQVPVPPAALEASGEKTLALSREPSS